MNRSPLLAAALCLAALPAPTLAVGACPRFEDCLCLGEPTAVLHFRITRAERMRTEGEVLQAFGAAPEGADAGTVRWFDCSNPATLGEEALALLDAAGETVACVGYEPGEGTWCARADVATLADAALHPDECIGRLEAADAGALCGGGLEGGCAAGGGAASVLGVLLAALGLAAGRRRRSAAGLGSHIFR